MHPNNNNHGFLVVLPFTHYVKIAPYCLFWTVNPNHKADEVRFCLFMAPCLCIRLDCCCCCDFVWFSPNANKHYICLINWRNNWLTFAVFKWANECAPAHTHKTSNHKIKRLRVCLCVCCKCYNQGRQT